MTLKIDGRTAHPDSYIGARFRKRHRGGCGGVAASNNEDIPTEERGWVFQSGKHLFLFRPRHNEAATIGERSGTDEEKACLSRNDFAVPCYPSYRAHVEVTTGGSFRRNRLNRHHFFPGCQGKATCRGDRAIIRQSIFACRLMSARDKERNAADRQFVGGREVTDLLRVFD